MSQRDADRSDARPGRRATAGLLAACGLAVAACGGVGKPGVAVEELNWACAAARCTVTFRLNPAGDVDSRLLMVRAYAGDSVASREIVGEHRERVTLRSGQSRRLTVTVETERPANRVRVIVE